MKRTRNPTRMTEILEAEALVSDSAKKKKPRKRTVKGKHKKVDPELEVNSEFMGSSNESSTSSDEGDESEGYEILNEEVRINLELFIYKIKQLFSL